MACPICPHTLNTHRQTVLRPAQANAYSSLSLRQILPPIWVVVGTIHGLMPSPSNPCPVGQGYMAVHQGTHNTARFIALPYSGTEKSVGCPHLHCPAKKPPLPLNCEHKTSWPAQPAGNSLIWSFYKGLGTSPISPNTFPTLPFMGSDQLLNMELVIVDLNSPGRSFPIPMKREGGGSGILELQRCARHSNQCSRSASAAADG